jgi:hypothetical protein
MQTKFIPGRSYSTRSACDHECIFSIEVLKRTEKTVTIRKSGDRVKTCRISDYDGAEMIKPWGSYSMCPIIRADRLED